jgi:hypothetical protein
MLQTVWVDKKGGWKLTILDQILGEEKIPLKGKEGEDV